MNPPFLPRPSRHVAKVAAAAAAVVLCGAAFPAARAQNTVAALPKTAKKGGGGGKGHKQTPLEQAQRELARLEKITGKPLTVGQKMALVSAYTRRRAAEKAATDTFNAAVAQTLGMPVETLKQKYKAARDAERTAAKSKIPAAAPR